MKTVTYNKGLSEEFNVEYDPTAPCIGCGLPVVEASMGGTVLCPWCDTGYDRYGRRVEYRVREANTEEKKIGKDFVWDNAFKATKEQYDKAVKELSNV